MSNTLIGIPGEVTKAAVKATALSGRLALRISGNFLNGSVIGDGHEGHGYVPDPDAIRAGLFGDQDVIKDFEDRFAISADLPHLLEPGISPRELEARAKSTTDALVTEGVVDEDVAAVEVRTILAGDGLRDPAQNARREEVIGLLGHLLARDYDIPAIPNHHPILPTEHEESDPDTNQVWGVFAAELDGFSHQIMEGNPRHRLAMLAITGPGEIKSYFRHQIVGHHSLENNLLVLRHAGPTPAENRLVPVR